MAGGFEFPAFLKLEMSGDQSAESEFVARVERMMGAGQASIRNFGQQAKSTLDAALATSRTNTGSLDLGVDDLKLAAQAQQMRAVAAREVADATIAAARAEGTFTREVREGIAAAKGLAAAEEEAARATLQHATAASRVQAELNKSASAVEFVAQASRRGTDAHHMAAESTRGLRQASLQAGQQLQDMAISLYSGQNASVVFAQQLPQLAFALTSLEGSTNRSHDRIGRFASFLSGPWGLAVGLATGVLGSLIVSLFQSEDAADASAAASGHLSQALDFQRMSHEELTKAISEQNDEARRSVENSYAQAEAARALAEQNVNAAITARERLQAELELARLAAQTQARLITRGGGAGESGAYGPTMAIGSVAIRTAESRLDQNQAQMDGLEEQLRLRQIPLIRREIEAANDGAAAATLRFEKAENDLNEAFEKGSISREQYRRDLARLHDTRERDTKAAREQDRIARSGSPRRERVSEEQRAYERATEAASRYLDRLDEQIQTLDFGQSQMRQFQAATEAAAAEQAALVAPTEAAAEALRRQAEQIRNTAAALEEDIATDAIEKLRQESERRLQIDDLILSGRETQARVLQEIWRLEGNVRDLTADERAEVEAIIRLEEERIERNQRLYELQSAYLDATRSVRSELEAVFAGEGDIGNFGQIFKRLQSRVMVEQIFGDTLRGLDDYVRRETGIEGSVDHFESETERAGNAALVFAQATHEAARIISDPQYAAFTRDFDGALGANPAANDNGVIGGAVSPDIIVNGIRQQNQGTVNGLTPEAYFEHMSRRLTDPLMAELDEIFGTRFFAGLSGVFSKAMYGLATGGTVGGTLGGAQGLVNKFGADIFGGVDAESISRQLGAALEGAQKGQMIAGIGNMLGLGMSNTGSQIGGAIGSIIPGIGPIASVIGSVAGGFLGGLFKSNKKDFGTVSISNIDALGRITSRGDQGAGQASGLGGSVQEGLKRIADALDAQVGAFDVMIGVYNGKYRVRDSSHGWNLKGGLNFSGSSARGLHDFGEDEAAALAYAVANAIGDGAIKGLREAEARLLKQNKDIERAIRDVLDFRSVFDRLREYKDPLGAALDTLDKEFERLNGIFERAGASTEEYAQLEELYGIERAKAVEDANQRITGALKGLLDDLTIGDNGLSLRTRRANALAEYNPLAERVEAGDTTAYDAYADAARALLEIERQMFGSTQDYFARMDEITGLTRERIGIEENIASIAENRDSPFDGSGRVRDAVENQTGEITGRLDAINTNIINLASYMRENGSPVRLPTPVARERALNF